MTNESSFWLNAPSEGFSAKCVDYFDVNFNQSDCFVVRSEFIKTKGRRSHQLQKHTAIPTTRDANLARGRKVSRVKHIGTRMSEKAMQSGALLG